MKKESEKKEKRNGSGKAGMPSFVFGSSEVWLKTICEDATKRATGDDRLVLYLKKLSEEKGKRVYAVTDGFSPPTGLLLDKNGLAKLGEAWSRPSNSDEGCDPDFLDKAGFVSGLASLLPKENKSDFLVLRLTGEEVDWGFSEESLGLEQTLRLWREISSGAQEGLRDEEWRKALGQDVSDAEVRVSRLAFVDHHADDLGRLKGEAKEFNAWGMGEKIRSVFLLMESLDHPPRFAPVVAELTRSASPLPDIDEASIAEEFIVNGKRLWRRYTLWEESEDGGSPLLGLARDLKDVDEFLRGGGGGMVFSKDDEESVSKVLFFEEDLEEVGLCEKLADMAGSDDTCDSAVAALAEARLLTKEAKTLGMKEDESLKENRRRL